MQSLLTKKLVLQLFLLLMSSFFFLFELNELPVRLWDESRNAVNAIEMMESGDLITRTYDGQADMYELKPPLLIWMQTSLLYVLGYTEWALRLPSAISGILLSILIFGFVSRKSNPFFGFLGALSFFTALAVLGPHMFRYGDHDALLILFLTISMLSVFAITEHKSRSIFFVILPLNVLMAILSKSVMGLTFLPATFLWLIYRRKLKLVLSNKRFIIASLFSITVLLTYYLLREKSSPGYLDKVYNNELFRRYLNTSTDVQYETEPAWYYVKGLFDRFKPMFIFIPLFIFTIVRKWDRTNVFFSLFFFLYLAIISFGTKNFWYDGPLYPILSMMIAYQLYGLYRFLERRKLVVTVLCIIGMAFLLNVGFERLRHPDEKFPKTEFYNMSYELRDYLNKGEKINKVVLMKGYDKHLKFYIKALNKRGSNIISKPLFAIEEGDEVLFSELDMEFLLRQKFHIEITNRNDRVVECKIIKQRT